MDGLKSLPRFHALLTKGYLPALAKDFKPFSGASRPVQGEHEPDTEAVVGSPDPGQLPQLGNKFRVSFTPQVSADAFSEHG